MPEKWYNRLLAIKVFVLSQKTKVLHSVPMAGMGVRVRVGKGVPTPTNTSWIPAGCPTVQLNSDTIYLDIASYSTV